MAKKRILSFLLTFIFTTPLVEFKGETFNSKPRKSIDCVERINLRTYEIDQVQEIIDFEIQKLKEIEEEEQRRREEERLLKQQKINDDRAYWKFEVSFYDSCYDCTQNGNGKTASGEYAQEGVTIALPKDIPFGSEVHIEGTGDYIVQDRGGYIEYTYDIEGNLVMRVDVYVSSHSKALEFGRYYADGYIDIKN